MDCTLQLLLVVVACYASTVLSQTPGDDIVTCEGSNQKIRASWICDGKVDCLNGADEDRCARNCDADQFICNDGECIQYRWLCDGTYDCDDGSDEAQVHCAMTLSSTCRDFQFDCGNGVCIRRSFVCDETDDCGNGMDETNCNPTDTPTTTSPLQCSDGQFACSNNELCISLNWKCDGEFDCADKSDESIEECGDVIGECGFGFFNCSSGGCIDINQVCDGRPDCLVIGDNSDEEGCPTEEECSPTEFRCPDRTKGCIPLSFLCDGDNDCGDGTDEIGCDGVCASYQVPCFTDGCINSTQLCDGVIDCEDDSDEYRCRNDPPPIQCGRYQFRCLDNHQCVDKEAVCDGIVNCSDGSDEDPTLCRASSGSTESGSGFGLDLSGCMVNPCDQRCVEAYHPASGYFCTCNSGYLLNGSDFTSCVDYDECSDPDRCSQLCHNSEGGFTCSCADGYVADVTNGAECVAASGPPAKLLFVNRVDIRAVGVNGRNHELLVKHLHNAIAVDYHYRLGYMFWTDVVQETINRALLNGSNVTTIISTGLKDPDGLAVDWINDKLYWADADTERIEVSNLDGSNRTVLFANNIGILRAIIVDPTSRYLFWSDWGDSPRIERASMDGKERTVLHSDHMAWPNGLTIDYATHTLYWIDAKILTIESSFIDGSNRRPIRLANLRHPFALTMFEDQLYWSDWQRKSIYTTAKFTRSFNGTFRDYLEEEHTELIQDLLFPMDVKVLHPLRQPQVPNPCAEDNGGCHYLCLLSATNEQGYSCVCPSGIRVGDDGKSCDPLETFILMARRDEIFRISLDVSEFIDVRIPLANLTGATALDWDDKTDRIFYTDVMQNTISTAYSDGSNQTVIINDNLLSPVGLAVDWLTNKIYWTEDDPLNDRIEVANLDGSDRAIVVLGSERNPIHKPRDIVVHPQAGLMFWTDWGRYPKIERANLDGSGRIAIVTSNLTYPNGLAIDYESNLLYWCDAGYLVIEYSNLDGEDRTILTSGGDIIHPFGLMIYQNWVYWTDWRENSLHRVDKLSGGNREVIFTNLDNKPMDVHVYHRNRTRGESPCAIDNGGCSHHCLSRPSASDSGRLEPSCACPTGHLLKQDGRTCNPVVDSYLLFPIGESLHEISLDTSDQYLIDFTVQVPMFRAATSVAVDIMTDEIYWADRVESKIFKASRGGPRITVIGVDIYTPESIAIDWIGRKLYWADSAYKRIEVSNLDGTVRRVLFWTNIARITSIAIDLESYHIFWSDAGNPRILIPGKIERADMDGNNRQQIVTRNVGSPMSVVVDNPTGLGGRIYWTDSFHGVIETADLQGGNRVNLITFSDADKAVPRGMAVEGQYIYWIDTHYKSVNRARKSDGNEQIKIRGGAGSLSSITVIKKSQLQRRESGLIDHPCDGTNQGCSDLCLPNPGLAKYSCSCTTGIDLLDDDKTCKKLPPLFLLIASRIAVRRISMDPKLNNHNDVALISGLNNTLAIDYRLTALGEGQMIFSDKVVDTIFTADFDGTNIRPIVTGITSIEGLTYDWVGKNIYWTDNIRNSLEVARFDGQHRRVLIYGEDDVLDRPRGISVDPERGLLFVSDWSRRRPSISVSKMDGTGFRYLIISGVYWPNGIALDRENLRIYWIDAYLDKMESASYSGQDRHLLIDASYTFHPYDIVFYKGYVFWSSIFNGTMHQARVRNNTAVNQMIVRGVIYGPAQFQMVDLYNPRPGELSPTRDHGVCAVNNGGCRYLCLARSKTERTCACPDNLSDCETEVVTDFIMDEQTTSASLPNSSVMTTDGKTASPPSTPLIELITLNGPGTGAPVIIVDSELDESQSALSTGIVASMVVIAFIMLIIVLVVVLVTALIIKRQNDKNERQQRQLESMRRLQFTNASYGKLNSMNSPQRVSGTFTNSNPEAVIGNLLPKRNNNYNTAQPKPPQHIQHVQQEERGGHSKHRFHFHRNSSSSTKRSSANVNTNVYMEEPEVYQLPPKPQPKRSTSIPDSPLLKPSSLKPPAPPPPSNSGTEDIEIVKEDLSKTAGEATPPPRPPKKSVSSSDTGSSAGELSPLTGRKPGKQSKSTQSKSRAKSCERGVHFDPSLPKEEEPPPLPPRSAITEDVPAVVPTSVGVGSTGHKKRKTPPIPSTVITVHATMEGEGAGSTPPPSYCVAMEMEPHSDSGGETSSLEGSGGVLSDCTASTELGHEVISENGEREGGIRHSSPESCESSC